MSKTAFAGQREYRMYVHLASSDLKVALLPSGSNQPIGNLGPPLGPVGGSQN